MLTNCKIIGANVSQEVYRASGAKRGEVAYSMSRSSLCDFAVNPAKWLAWKYKDDATPSTEWGNALDCLLTAPKEFDRLFAVCPETYQDAKTGEQKPWTFAANVCKAWKAENEGKIILKNDTWLAAQEAVKQIQSSPDVWSLIQCSAKQVMVAGEWRDKETGCIIPIRGLLDLVPDAGDATWGKTLADFKTARNGNPATWARVCDDQGYDVQAALYFDLYNFATGENRTDFVFAVQENEPPYHVTTPLPAMSQEFLEYGRQKYQAALAYYARCLATSTWPGYRAAGMVMGPTQLIGPDTLWSYRQQGGQLTARQDYSPAEPKPKFISETPT